MDLRQMVEFLTISELGNISRAADYLKVSQPALSKSMSRIEEELGISLKWERADEYKASSLCYYLDDVSITNEADWPRMAKFHAEWSYRICKAVLPYLQDETDINARRIDIACIFREWTINRNEVNENLEKCSLRNTRFTTNGMSEILPDISGAPSGWNTDNHYFYEIVNLTGKSAYIRLSISSRNATDEFLSICDQINEYYPSKFGKKDWKWRNPFKTTTIEIGEELSKDAIFASLDRCLEEIQDFEEDLKKKLKYYHQVLC